MNNKYFSDSDLSHLPPLFQAINFAPFENSFINQNMRCNLNWKPTKNLQNPKKFRELFYKKIVLIKLH
jgi:hypothetical protein